MPGLQLTALTFSCAALTVTVAATLLGLSGRQRAFESSLRGVWLQVTYTALVLGTTLWGIQYLLHAMRLPEYQPGFTGLLWLINVALSFAFLAWFRSHSYRPQLAVSFAFTLLLFLGQLASLIGSQPIGWAALPALLGTFFGSWAVAYWTSRLLRTFEGTRIAAAFTTLVLGTSTAITLLTLGTQYALIHERTLGWSWPEARTLSGGLLVFVIASGLTAALDLRIRRERELTRLVAERTAALEDERQFQRALLDNLNDQVIVSDHRGRLVQHNAALHDLNGQPILGTPSEAWASTYGLTTPAFDRLLEQEEIPLFRALQGEQIRSALFGVERGGQRRLMTANASPIHGPDGALRGAVVAMNDVTDFEQQRMDALRTAEHHSAVLQAMDEGMILLSPDGLILTLNRRARELLSVTSDATTFGELTRSLEVRTSRGELVSHDDLSFHRVREGARQHLETVYQVKRPDGTLLWVRTLTQGLFRDGELWGVLHTLMDVTDRRLLREELERLAQFSPVTGLPNRAHSVRLIEAAVLGGTWTVLVIRCATIADLRAADDADGVAQLIQWHARRVREVFQNAAVIGQIDEQAIIVLAREESELTLDHLRGGGHESMRIDYHIGSFTWTGNFPAHDAVRHAESAAEHAAQKGTFLERYEAEQVQTRRRLRKIEQHLQRAVEQAQLQVHYQPIVDLQTGELSSAEALVRWNDPELGFIPPDQFIPVAERLGLIDQVTRLVTVQAMGEARRAQALGIPVKIAVNLSPTELTHAAFLSRLHRLLDWAPDAPTWLTFEITESGVIHDLKAAATLLTQVRDAGFRVALDDFGTGYSALSTLQQLPIDTVKLDRTFVWGIEKDQKQRLLTGSVIELAARQGLDMVAEGVESVEQAELLRGMGCARAQGYLFSRPLAQPDWADLRSRWGGGVATDRTPTSAR